MFIISDIDKSTLSDIAYIIEIDKSMSFYAQTFRKNNLKYKKIFNKKLGNAKYSIIKKNSIL